MLKTIILFLAAILLLTKMFAQTKVSSYKIEGKVKGFSDGTMLYLNDATGILKQIDSALIHEGKFIFEGKLRGKYLNATISTTDFKDRVYFWIDNGLTNFSAEKGNFFNAVITGTKLQEEQNKLYKLRDTLSNTSAIDYWFIKNNSTSIIAANTLNEYCNSWGRDTLTTLFKTFPQNVKESVSGKKIKAFITFNRNIKIGDKFVDFTQKDTSNKNIKLSNFKGKIILLDFWGSWCGPCREQNPALIKIYNEFKSTGFEIFGVATEYNKKDWIKAIAADGLPWINVTDLKTSSNKAAIIYGVSGYPTNFLIDRNGTIIGKDIYGEDLRKMLLKMR